MHLTAKSVFHQYAADLEHEPGLWGMRLFDLEDGGLVWRNRAHREFYEPHGFYASATLPWQGVKAYFTPKELGHLERAYAAAFTRQRPVARRLVFGEYENYTRFFAVFGNLRHGVVVTHSEPSSFRRWRAARVAA